MDRRGRAFGKLNLTLDILGKRPDGYHDLRMVMASVSLADDVSVRTETGRPWSVRCVPESGSAVYPQDSENLCWRAAEIYFGAAGIDPDGMDISVVKRIPSGAGMAGGSADAAAVLRILNSYYRFFSDEKLRELGLLAGSDVPYCLFGGTALAEGRGERLTRLPSLPANLSVLLARPDFSVSTPELFRAVDEAGVTQRPETASMVRAIRAGDAAAIGRLLCNAFTPEVSRRYPVTDTICRTMRDCGALGAELTGTGSVVFGIFADDASAKNAADALRPCCVFTSVETFVN